MVCTLRPRRCRPRWLRLESLESRQVMANDLGEGPAFSPYESAEQFEQDLVSRAVQQYAGQFGQEAWWCGGDWHGPPIWYRDGGHQLFLASATTADLTSDALDHSTTNTQVAGVDEGDLVETDGQYVYLISGAQVVVLDVRNASDMQVASRIAISGTPQALYLRGNRLTVIATGSDSLGEAWAVPQWDSQTPGNIAAFSSHSVYAPEVAVAVYDLTDKTQPVLVERTVLDGSYFNSRAIGDRVYVLTQQNLFLPGPTVYESNVTTGPQPPAATTTVRLEGPRVLSASRLSVASLAPDSAVPVTQPSTEPTTCFYETQEEYVARMHDYVWDTLLPQFTAYDGQGGVVSEGLLTESTSTYRTPSDGSAHMTVTSFDVADESVGPIDSTALLTDHVGGFYASAENFYLFEANWQSNWTVDMQTTDVLKLSVEGETGHVAPAAFGNVPGQFRNQFFADEHEGYLRVVTSDSWRGPTNVFVLSPENDRLEIVGSLTGLAPNESLRSVRFVGDRAFVVTFLEVIRFSDPLFAIDLSDPAAPRVLGELEISGFSQYIHPIDSTHLLTVGRDVDPVTGADLGFQVSLFDVSDMTQPRLVDRHLFAGNWTSSEASWDHHAFLYDPESGTLALPLSRHETIWIDENGDGQADWPQTEYTTTLSVFTVSAEGLEVAGEIEHGSTVRRSLRIGEVLFSLSHNSIKASDLVDPSRSLGSLVFGMTDAGALVFGTPTFFAPPTFWIESGVIMIQSAFGFSIDLAVPTLAASFESDLPLVPTTEPAVGQVLVASSKWDDVFLERLRYSADGFQANSHVGWSNLDQVKVRFLTDVAVQADDFVVRDATGTYGVRRFDYDPTTRTAVWTLDRALAAGRLTLASVDAIFDRAGQALDQDGDGQPGGSFDTTIDVLPGDVDRDGDRDGADYRRLRRDAGASESRRAFNPASDLDGNGRIDGRDLASVRRGLERRAILRGPAPGAAETFVARLTAGRTTRRELSGAR